MKIKSEEVDTRQLVDGMLSRIRRLERFAGFYRPDHGADHIPGHKTLINPTPNQQDPSQPDIIAYASFSLFHLTLAQYISLRILSIPDNWCPSEYEISTTIAGFGPTTFCHETATVTLRKIHPFWQAGYEPQTNTLLIGKVGNRGDDR